MTALLDRISTQRHELRNSIDWWLQNYLMPASTQFGYDGHTYIVGTQQTSQGTTLTREVSTTLPGYLGALRTSPPAFAAQMVRAAVLSQARFTFRNVQSSPTPRRTFGTGALSLLEKPWPNGTTGELLSRMEWHAGLAGNAYVVRQARRLRVLRPDWVGILYGSQKDPGDPLGQIDAEVLGYVYQPGGFMDKRGEPTTLLPEEMAHWTPLPDPMSPGIGMSWITPGLRDIQGDQAFTEHKLAFVSNGATPNLVIKNLGAQTKEQFDEIIDKLEERHVGVRNAYRTLYLNGGADVEAVGKDLKELDYKAVQGAGETRIAMLSRVPAALLQISEGLQGSSLNAGNFGMSRRIFADSWVFPVLQDVCRALAPLIAVPLDAELWFDTADIPLLREDQMDAAEIVQSQATTIGNLVKEGFTAVSAIAAVKAQDMSLLKHTGLVSVQLQLPGSGGLPIAPKPANGVPVPSNNGGS